MKTFFQNQGQYLIKQLYPALGYFRLVVQSHQIILLRIEGQTVVRREVYQEEQVQIDTIKAALSCYSAYPIQLFLSDQDVTYRLVDLSGVKKRDCKAVIQQVLECEFGTTNWVQKQLKQDSGGQSGYTLKCILVGICPSALALAVVKLISQTANPIESVQLTPLAFVQQVFKSLPLALSKEGEDKSDEQGWVLILTQKALGHWELTVCRDQMVVLQRKGRLSNEDPLKAEILSTLHYLKRLGYQEGERLTLIQVRVQGAAQGEMEDRLSNRELHDLTDYPNLTFRTLEQTFSVEESSAALPKVSYKRSIALVPSPQGYTVLSHCLAFALPLYILRLSLLLIIILGGLSLGMLGFLYHSQGVTHSLLEEKIKYFVGKAEKQSLITLNFFDHYQALEEGDPLPLLKTIGKIFTNHGVITSFQWRQEKTKSGFSIKLDLDLETSQTSLIQEKRKGKSKEKPEQSFLSDPLRDSGVLLATLQNKIFQDLKAFDLEKAAALEGELTVRGTYPLLSFSLTLTNFPQALFQSSLIKSVHKKAPNNQISSNKTLNKSQEDHDRK